jgi:hypothetical protein
VPDEKERLNKLRADTEQLRGETAKAQIDFLKTELQSCLTLLSVAEGEWERGEREHAAASFRHAAQGYAKLVRFLSDPNYVGRIPGQTYAELKAQVAQLRTMLDRSQKRMH